MFIQHLGGRKVKILLRDMHTAFAQRIHAGLSTHTLKFRAGAAVHLLGDLSQVDAARKIHAAAVDAEDVGAGFDAKEGVGVSEWRGGGPWE